MDFHTLSRKELQSLCKKNKIPANITNLAMAHALSSLPHVEGLDEFLNPTEGDGGAGIPTTRRAAAQRKPESASRVQRWSRAKNVEVEQDSSTRRRKPLPVSTLRKKEEIIVLDDDDDGVQLKDVPKTPTALSSCRTRATGRTARGGTTSYNTRRSVRLLEKNLSNMTLLDTQDMAPNNLEQEMNNVSHQTQDSDAGTQKVNDAGDSLQTVSTVVSEETYELEVSNLDKNTEYEECQSHHSVSELQIVSGTENDVAVVGLQADHPEEEEGPGMVSCLEAEPHDSNWKLDESSETCNDSNEVGECSDELANKSIATGEAVDKDNTAGSDNSSELEIGIIQDTLSVQAAEDANMAFAGQDDDALSVEVSDDADQYFAGSIPMSSESNNSLNLEELVECNTDNHGSNEDDDNKDKNNETSDDNYFQSFKPMFDADEKDLAIPEEVLEHQEEELEAKSEHSEESMADIDKMDDVSDVTGTSLAVVEFSTEPSADKSSMDAEIVLHESSLVDVAVREAKYLVHNSEKLEAEAAFDISAASSAALASEVDTTSENPMTVMEFCSESLADKVDAENATLESSLFDVVVNEAEDLKVNSVSFEAKAQLQDSEELAFDVCGASSDILAAELDATSENSTNIEFCSESSGDKISIDADKVTLESSLLDVGVPEAGELKDDDEKLDFKAQAEESEEHSQAEELKDNCEKLDFKSQAEESEEHAEAEETKDNSEKLDFMAQAEVSEEHSQAEELKDNCEKLDFKSQAEESEEHAEAEESEEHAEAEETKDNSEKLDFMAQAEVSEEHAAGEESALDVASAFPSVLGGTCDPQIPQQILLESDGKSTDDSRGALIMSVLSCYSNTLVDGDVTSEEIAIPKQESSVLAVAPINEQKISEIPIPIPIQSTMSLCVAQSEVKGFANEIQTVQKMINTEENMPNVNMMKENLSTAELDKKSVRELKKMLKNLTLDSKPNCKSKTTNVVKEVEKKRTALQALPENRMTNGEAQNDG